jgi:uncharacterized protein YgiM (DUF1202 family)
MRAGAGSEFEVIDTLAFGQVVSVGNENGDWIEVDLQDDGVIDGWVYKSYLVKD